MRVELRFYAGLRDYLPDDDGPAEIDLPDGARVRDVIERFGIPRDKPRILLVNGRHAALDTVLRDGDLLVLFPPVAGG